jgi:hypothetical protein
MQDKAIGHGNRRLFVAGLCLGLLAALGVWRGSRYLTNVLFGPFAVRQQDLLTLTDPDVQAHYFVTVEGDEVETLFPRAYAAGREPYSMYALLRVGDKWLLLWAPHGQASRRWTGSLEALSEFERRHVLGPRQTGPGGPREFLPYRLNATRPFRAAGWLLAVLPLGGLVMLSAGLLLRALTRFGPPRPSVLEHEVLPVMRVAAAVPAAGLAGEKILGRGVDVPNGLPAGLGGFGAEPASPVDDEPRH